MHRLIGGGRDSWRAPAVAPNTAESRPARDRTTLREVSARLDAAATAIDAVEIGVRSAADSLDSLLQLLESRQGSAGTAPATTTSSSRAGGTSAEEASASPATAVAAVPSSADNGPVTGAIPEAVSGGFAGSTPLAAADGEVSPVVSAHGREGGGGLRAANMLRRETLVGSTSPASRRPAEERANTVEHDCRTASFATQCGVDGTLEDPVAVRDALVEEVKEDLGSPSRPAENSPVVLLTPRLAPSSTGRDPAEDAARSTSVEEQASRASHDEGRQASSATLGNRAESAPAAICPRAGDGSVTMEQVVTGHAAVRHLGDSTRLHSSQTPERTRPSPRGMRAVGSNSTLPVDGAEVPANPDRVLEQQVVEMAMENIDAERGRLILEIARLRGQQHQSLAHLRRLQQEQFVVRQRQVSTLSDIVNSFGRTVEAASALPHGDNSPLGRISSDVVSTLRRMLRLLSATVPVAAPGGRSARVLSTTTATRPDGALPSSTSARHPRSPAREGSSAAGGSSGTDSVGGRVALRPTGADLTQQVIDAALQALPRLAAAATAISGARRIQGYAAGLAGGAPGVGEERRCCSTETIAALPDASPYAEGVVEGVDGGGGDDGHRGCVICLSEGSVTTQLLCRLPCNHVFHRVCVGKWLRMHDSCPTCRRQVPNIEVGATATTTPV